MKVLLTGGGTGGHITPLLAVAQKLKALDPGIEIVYVGERHAKFASMTADVPEFDRKYKVFSGKFRRYHGESWLKRLLNVKTNLQNLRDAFYVLLGTVQSWFLLRRVRPDVILLKGGFVGVPIGLAARGTVPMVTHDSDALPGLANRLVSRWARYHATGMPPEFYTYPKDSMIYTGVLVGDQFKRVTPKLQSTYKEDIGVPASAQLLFITGGSLGAQALNTAMVAVAPRLLKKHPKLHIIHQVGRNHTDCYGNFHDNRLVVLDLVTNMYKYTGAADVVVTRAGANTLAEIGTQGRATIVVPNPILTGGHQLENAKHLADKRAVEVIDETALTQNDARALADAIEDLLEHSQKRQHLAEQLHDISVPNAAKNLAKLLIQVGSEKADN